MRKMISLFSCLAGIVSPGWLYAQQIDTAIASRFPDAVVARLYDVTSKLHLPGNSQLALARQFLKEDSLVADAIKKGASETAISDIQLSQLHAFQALLTPAQLQLYYSRKAGDNAKTEARLAAGVAKKKYGCDSVTALSVYDASFAQLVNTHRVLLQYAGDASLADRLAEVTEKYGPAVEKQLYKAAGYHFIQDKLDTLNHIKVLSPKDRDALKNAFLNLSYKSEDKSFTENFYQVMRSLIHDTVYYAGLYKKEIGQQADMAMHREARRLLQKRKLPKEASDTITYLLYQKNKSLAIYEYAMPLFSPQKDTIVRTTRAYFDSIVKKVLVKNDPPASKSRFGEALRNRQQLRLTKPEVDSLLALDVRLAELKTAYAAANPDGRFDAQAFEIEQLPLLLGEPRFQQLLLIENTPAAMKWARGDWEEMKQKGIAAGYDSVVVINQIFNYDVAKAIAKSRFRNDKIKQNGMVKTLIMPEPLKRLTAVRNGSPIADKDIQGTLE